MISHELHSKIIVMSLTNTSKKFRSGARVGCVVIFLYYLAILLVIPKTKDFFTNLFKKEDNSNPIFGLLDPLKFYSYPTNGPAPTITLNTKDGRLPSGFPNEMPVFKFKGLPYSYLAAQGAIRNAAYLGYKETELISDLKGKIYQWRSQVSGGNLTINLDTQEMVATTDLLGAEKEYRTGNIDQGSALAEATRMLKAVGGYNGTLYDKGNHIVSLGYLSAGNIKETKVSRDAQIARVDFIGKIQEWPVVSQYPNRGIISVFLRKPIGGASTPYNFPRFNITNWDWDFQNPGSYAIITPSEAWKSVSQGKGIITQVIPKNSDAFSPYQSVMMDRILVDKIYLAYYQTLETQQYLQPIYVFEGKYQAQGTDGGSVTIYYPAIAATYTKPVENPQPETE